MTTAIYPGTFDPITKGHVDIIQRASRLFDTVIVGIATSVRKTPYFDLDKRVAMVNAALSGFANVTVYALDGLLIDCAKANQATVILRGLRAVSDFDYEFQLASMNRALDREIETVFLPATQEHAYISATMVREILSLGGDVSGFVPEVVSQMLSRG